MLSKLLKHEFRATGRVMLPVYLVLFLSAGLFCLTMHLADNYDLRALEIFRGLTAFVFGDHAASSCAASMFAVPTSAPGS